SSSRCAPRPTSQRITAPSSPPVASRRPSGANATASTPPGCPVGLAHTGDLPLFGVGSEVKITRAETRAARHPTWARPRIDRRTRRPAIGAVLSSSGEPGGGVTPNTRRNTEILLTSTIGFRSQRTEQTSYFIAIDVP